MSTKVISPDHTGLQSMSSRMEVVFSSTATACHPQCHIISIGCDETARPTDGIYSSYKVWILTCVGIIVLCFYFLLLMGILWICFAPFFATIPSVTID